MQNLGPFFLTPPQLHNFYRKEIVQIPFQFRAMYNLSGNTSEANVVYSDVKFIKEKEKATGESFLNMFILL